MTKYIFILTLSLSFFKSANAQKDTTKYYLTKFGKVVSTKDSADYYIIVTPSDSVHSNNAFIAKEYYRNGNIRWISGSLVSTYPLKLQGPYKAFFPNGSKMRISNYSDGSPNGTTTDYYPNSKLYNIKAYMPDNKLVFKECRDSTGKILAENGNGHWIIFNETFNSVEMEGQIKNGLQYGEWQGTKTDSSVVIDEFRDGKIVSIANSYKSGNKIYTMIETAPEFSGGLTAFGAFLSKNIVYPKIARQNGTKGRIIITFIVETDGALSNLKVVRGIGNGCDEEALRVMKLCPKWKPGMQDGNPVRVAYAVPISFTLTR